MPLGFFGQSTLPGAMMSSRSFCVLTSVVILSGLNASRSDAQRPPGPRGPEYLVVPNGRDGPVWVYLRAKGGERPDQNWQPGQTVGPFQRAAIQLRGYQPFDVLILRPSGSYTRINDAMLCQFMDDCWSGVHTANVKAVNGTWTKSPTGEFLLGEPQDEETITLSTRYTKVEIPQAVVQYDGSRKPRIPPRRK
jgi:hypothetical protein